MSTFPATGEVLPPHPQPPSYPDPRPYFPHPYIPAGLNDAPIAGDDVNGGGLNTVRYATFWDDVLLSRATIVMKAGTPEDGIPLEYGMTVDYWVGRERTRFVVPPERARLRASGYRGRSA